ncbi:Uncharacterised protein [Vibrio cholerae]|nr:Uncharacterised protein [Vibrio cholerae]
MQNAYRNRGARATATSLSFARTTFIHAQIDLITAHDLHKTGVDALRETLVRFQKRP